MTYNDCVENTSYNTTLTRRSLYQSHESPASSHWVSVDGVLPYSEYSIQVNASNSRGFVLSNIITLNMPSAGLFDIIIIIMIHHLFFLLLFPLLLQCFSFSFPSSSFLPIVLLLDDWLLASSCHPSVHLSVCNAVHSDGVV